MKDLTLRQLLDPLPRRICTYFASQCTKDAIQRSGAKDPAVLLAQDVAERYGNGEDFDEAYLKEVANKASAFNATYASAVAYSAAYSAAASAAAAYAAHSAAYAAASAYSVAVSADARAYYEENYKPLLLKILNERLTPLEFMLYFGEEKK